MTNGLIISRRTKNNLHALAVSEPIPAIRVISAAKKQHIASKLTENAGNPKNHGKL